jgi:hypothetical protein
MMIAAFWDVFLHSLLQLLVTVNVVPTSVILFTLMTEQIRSSENFVRKGATRDHITDGVHQVFSSVKCSDTGF